MNSKNLIKHFEVSVSLERIVFIKQDSDAMITCRSLDPIVDRLSLGEGVQNLAPRSGYGTVSVQTFNLLHPG